MSAVLAGASYFADPSLLSTPDCVALVSGCLSGVILSPDQDCDNGYIGLFYLRRIWIIGPTLSKLWQMYWWPYARIVRHRSFISHLPLFSTLIREIIVIIPALIILWVFQIEINISIKWFILFTAGLTLSDIQHSFADFLSGEARE